MQYDSWIEELRNIEHTVKSPIISDMPKAKNVNINATEELAIRRAMLQDRIDMIHKAAEVAGEELSEYIIKGVTKDGVTYNYLSTMLDIPCGKNKYYECRRKFYWVMDQMLQR